MLKRILILTLLLNCNLLLAQQDTSSTPADSSDTSTQDGENSRYISDDLYTFMHAGPGRDFRILGSVLAGSHVTFLQINEEKQFVEIIDDKQRTGWVDARFVVRKQSIREKLPEMEEQLTTANGQLQSYQLENDKLNQQLQSLSTRYDQLQQELATVKQASSATKQKLDTQDQSIQQEWFIRGGIIALAGILLGVIITYLPKKRRRNDNWM